MNKIYNERAEDTLDIILSKSIDMVLTSPPYDNLRKYNGFTFDINIIVSEIFRVLKVGGTCVWVVSDATIKGSETGTAFKQALLFLATGFRLHDTMIYAKKNHPTLTHNRYEQAFEYMYIFSKGAPKTFNPLKVACKEAGKRYDLSKNGSGKHHENAQRRRSQRKIITISDTKIKDNIWYYSTGADRTGHPAPFPLSLAEDHILSWSNEGDIIYDPFMGSGTTAIACIKNNRRYIGSEISKEYCDIADSRINKLVL